MNLLSSEYAMKSSNRRGGISLTSTPQGRFAVAMQDPATREKVIALVALRAFADDKQKYETELDRLIAELSK
jgi:hypothetical protein